MFRIALSLALVPFVVSAVTLLVAGRGYHTYSDNALTELNVRDVGHHLVEVGVFNRLGWHHLGPTFFYALAPIYRILGSRSYGLLLGALLINALTIVGIGLVARRRAGTGFAIAALAGSLFVAHAYGAYFLRSPWTPNIVVLGSVLIILLAWSLAEADMAMLPWAALVASWLVQTHIAPAPPVVATLLVGGVIGAAQIRSTSRRGRSDAVVPSLRRPLRLAGVVLLVVWFLPLVDVVTHGGGNLNAVMDYFLHSSGGSLSHGYDIVSSQLRLPPPWLGHNPIPTSFAAQYVIEPDAGVPWVGIALLVGIGAAWRARRSRALRFATIVAVGLVTELFAIGRIEGQPYSWDVLYVPATAMLAALAAAYAATSAVNRPTSPRWLRPTAIVVLLAALAVPATMLAVSSADPARVQEVDHSRGVAAVAPGTLRSLRGATGPVLVRTTTPDFRAWPDMAALVVLLDQHGFHGVVAPTNTARSHFPGSSIETTNSPNAVVTIVALRDLRHYRPTRREHLAAYAGRIIRLYRGFLIQGLPFAVFVASGTDTRPCAGKWSC